METAVEFLIQELFNNGYFPYGVPEDIVKIAEGMEKEQIINAFEIGYDNGACVQEGNAIYHGSNYYNETFKSE